MTGLWQDAGLALAGVEGLSGQALGGPEPSCLGSLYSSFMLYFLVMQLVDRVIGRMKFDNLEGLNINKSAPP